MQSSSKQRSVIQLVRRRGFKQFLHLVSRFKGLYITVILLQLGVTAASLLFAETNRRLFDLAPNIPKESLWNLLIAFTGFIALGIVCTLTARVFNQIVNTNIVFAMREMVLAQLTRLSLSYHENKNSSHAKNILFNELEVFKHFIVFDVLRLISLPISFVSVGLYLMVVHPVLGLIALAVGPLQLVSNLIIKERYKDLVARQQEMGREWFFHIGETLAGMREIKMNQLEQATMRKVNQVFGISIPLWISMEKMWAVREAVKAEGY